MKKLWFAILAIGLLASCQSVKPYHRAYLNDELMGPGSMSDEAFEQTVFNYREGAMVSGSKKGRGGCGCN